MNRLLSSSIIICAIFIFIAGCRKYEEPIPINRGVDISLTSVLQSFTGGNAVGFVGNAYDIRMLANSKFDAGNYNLAVKYTLTTGKGDVFVGTKLYSTSDTLLMPISQEKLVQFRPKESGLYNLTFIYHDEATSLELTREELTFEIASPDLAIMILKNGAEVNKLDDSPHFVEQESSFVIRTYSLREKLEDGKVGVSLKRIGSSVELKNWEDGQKKYSSPKQLTARSSAKELADVPEYLLELVRQGSTLQMADFVVEHKNISTGETSFQIAAETDNAQSSRTDKITVKHGTWGFVLNNAAYDEEAKQYSRPELWIGEVDSLDYLIDVNYFNVGTKVFKVKLEVADPTRVNIHWEKNLPTDADEANFYKFGEWYDFSDMLKGKLYYTLLGGTAYNDIIKITVRSGDLGKEITAAVAISARQTSDFDVSVNFKQFSTTPEPSINDTILFSELKNGIVRPVVIKVEDENPTSVFDYKIIQRNANVVQNDFRHRYGANYTVEYGNYEAIKTKYIKSNGEIQFTVLGTNQDWEGYIGGFDIEYYVKRKIDGKEKRVKKHIVVVDDRLNFEMESLVGLLEGYTNEPVNMFRLKYLNGFHYTNLELKVYTDDNRVLFAEYMTPTQAFTRVPLNTFATPPASHNGANPIVNGGAIVKIIGAKPGSYTVNFLLRDKVSGAERTLSRVIAVKDDPVQYSLTPAGSVDIMNKIRSAVPLNGTQHQLEKARIKLKIAANSLYSGNTAVGNVRVVFKKANANQSNVIKLLLTTSPTANTGDVIAFGNMYTLSTEQDYYLVLDTDPGNNASIIGLYKEFSLQITKAHNLDTPIMSEEQNLRYTIRGYQTPTYSYNVQVTNRQPLSNDSYSRWLFCKDTDYNYNVTVTGLAVSANLKSISLNALGDAQEIGYSPSSLSGVETHTSYTAVPHSSGWDSSCDRTEKDMTVKFSVSDNWGYSKELIYNEYI